MNARVRAGGLSLVIRDLAPEDEGGVLRLFDASQEWFEVATGSPSGPGDVQSLYYALPAGVDFEQKKLLVVVDGDDIVGVIDALLHYPEPKVCSVGLFLIAPSYRGRGVGRSLAAFFLDELRRADQRRVRTTVHPEWLPGVEFLSRLGFRLGPRVVRPSANRNLGPREHELRLAVLELS